MKQHSTLASIPVLCCATLLWLHPAFGFSTDSSSMLAISVDQNLALTNSPITVTVAFTNRSPNALQGFYYVDQLPTVLEPNLLRVKLNGQSITNCTIESGQEGDVYPDYTPQRYILELPPDFTPTNPVPEQGVVEIVYSISSSTPGTFSIQDFNWAGFDPIDTNVFFGYSEPGNQQTISFITADTPPSLYVPDSSSTNGFTVGIIGVPGYSYVVEASTNLQNWSSIATNIAPFELKANDESPSKHRFFRAFHLP